jgi:hypothetical protein
MSKKRFSTARGIPGDRLFSTADCVTGGPRREAAFPNQAAGWNALLNEWVAGLERLRGHPPRAGFKEAEWHQLKLDALALLGCHGPRLAALGWRTDELFGLDRDHACARVAASGLARFIHGGRVIAIDAEGASIRRLTGAVLRFTRTIRQPGVVPAWELHKENCTVVDYSIDLDAGQGDSGPWLAWHAAPTRDGAHQAGTWSARDAAGRTTVNLTPGLVIDWPASKTGWIQAGGVPGVAPQKRWNASRAKFEKQPGDDWKRAMRAPVAYVLNGTPAFAVWEQNSAAAWMGFVDLMSLLKETAPRELPKLPLVTFTGHRQVKLGNGVTLVPQFKLSRFVDRPTCLPDEDTLVHSSGDAWGSSAQRIASRGSGSAMQMASNATPLPTSEPAEAGGQLVDDEIPF